MTVAAQFPCDRLLLKVFGGLPAPLYLLRPEPFLKNTAALEDRTNALESRTKLKINAAMVQIKKILTFVTDNHDNVIFLQVSMAIRCRGYHPPLRDALPGAPQTSFCTLV